MVDTYHQVEPLEWMKGYKSIIEQEVLWKIATSTLTPWSLLVVRTFFWVCNQYSQGACRQYPWIFQPCWWQVLEHGRRKTWRPWWWMLLCNGRLALSPGAQSCCCSPRYMYCLLSSKIKQLTVFPGRKKSKFIMGWVIWNWSLRSNMDKSKLLTQIPISSFYQK